MHSARQLVISLGYGLVWAALLAAGLWLTASGLPVGLILVVGAVLAAVAAIEPC